MDDRTCQTAGEWYAASFEPHHHKLAVAEIASRGLVSYLPIEPRRERHGRGAMRTVWRPMLSSYLFVRCRSRDCESVTCCRGIRRLLRTAEGTPVSIDDGKIEVIRLVETEKAEAEGVRHAREAAEAIAKAGGRSGVIWDFSEGERVRIKTGPFAGLYAQLTAPVDERDRIEAILNMFGRKSVAKLSAFEIERAT